MDAKGWGVRGQPRLLQHPATVDLKEKKRRKKKEKWCLSVVVLLERVLNVLLSWQPRPQRWRTFLEDH